VPDRFHIQAISRSGPTCGASKSNYNIEMLVYDLPEADLKPIQVYTEEDPMRKKRYSPLTQEELASKINETPPNNSDASEGYALVNVLSYAEYAKEHIPNSINIPVDEIDKFEDHFSKEKELIVYCSSYDCDAAEKTAEALAERGFQRVYDFEEGLAGWKRAGQSINGVEASVAEVT
jgi:rhodanese-related sulfurtransferase